MNIRYIFAPVDSGNRPYDGIPNNLGPITDIGPSRSWHENKGPCPYEYQEPYACLPVRCMDKADERTRMRVPVTCACALDDMFLHGYIW